MTTGPLVVAPSAPASQSESDVTGSPSEADASLSAASGEAAAGPAPSGGGAVRREVDLAFAKSFRLVGYEVNRVRVSPGDTITATLYWQATQLLPASKFNVVVHVLDDGGHSVAHSDSIASRVPRSQSVQRIVDRHVLALADTLPAGSYRLVANTYLTDVGLYPASTDGTVAVLLAIIQVE